MLYRRQNFRTAVLDAEKVIAEDEELYWRAEAVATLPGWAWMNTRDDVKGDLMKEADIQDQLQEKNKTVARGGNFANPRHGGSSRA